MTDTLVDPTKQNAEIVTKILIVDDHELVRGGLRTILSNQDDMEVCGEASSVAEAKKTLRETDPDLVIVDLRLPDASGMELIKWIVTHKPAVKIVVATMYDEREYGERVLRLGASGYVCKQNASETVVEAIRQVSDGKYFFGEETTNEVLRRTTSRANTHGHAEPASPTSLLSDRELEILGMLGQGLTTDVIAQRLFLSRNTIGTYRERLKSKLNLKNSNELIRFAIHWEEHEHPNSELGNGWADNV